MTYARFGDAAYKYGTTTRYYGVGANDDLLHWAVEVDWDGNGSYDGSNEAPYCRGMQTARGRDAYLSLDGEGNATGFQDMKIGTLSVTLDNGDGRYNPYNTSGPHYPNVLPGRYIRIRVNYNGTTYNVFHGKIKDINPVINPTTGDRTARITAEDGQRLLQRTDSSVSIQQNIDIDDAIAKVLNDVNWPGTYGRNLEDSADVLPYWWAKNKAYTEISTLAGAELGTFFIAADGKATFYSRHHTAAASLTLDSTHILKDIAIPQPWEVVRNSVQVIAHPRVAKASGVLWTLQDKPLIINGDSLTVWGTYQYNNTGVPAINVAQPVASTDFTANTLSDGSGVDKTSGFTVVLTDFGETSKNVITNNSGSDAYLTLLQNKGQALVASDPSISLSEDSSSQVTYGKQLLTLDYNWLQSTLLAADFSPYLLSFLKSPQAFITTIMEGRPDKQFVCDLFDTLNQSVTALGIAATNFKVGGVSHQWLTENGQGVRTTFRLEPYLDTSGYWIFNISTGNVTMGVNTIFGL